MEKRLSIEDIEKHPEGEEYMYKIMSNDPLYSSLNPVISKNGIELNTLKVLSNNYDMPRDLIKKVVWAVNEKMTSEWFDLIFSIYSGTPKNFDSYFNVITCAWKNNMQINDVSDIYKNSINVKEFERKIKENPIDPEPEPYPMSNSYDLTETIYKREQEVSLEALINLAMDVKNKYERMENENINYRTIIQMQKESIRKLEQSISTLEDERKHLNSTYMQVSIDLERYKSMYSSFENNVRGVFGNVLRIGNVPDREDGV